MTEENPQVRFAAIKIGPNRFKNVAKVDPLPPLRKTKQSIGQVSINVEEATLEVSRSTENLKADLSKIHELDWIQYITPHKFKSDLYDLRRRMFLSKRSRIRIYNCGCYNTHRRKGICITDYWYWLLFSVTFWPLTGYIIALSKGLDFKRPWIFLLFGTVAWISQLVCVSIFLHDCVFENCSEKLWEGKYIAGLAIILFFHIVAILLFTTLRIHFTEIYHQQKKIFRSFLVTLFLCPCSVAQIATQLEENPFSQVQTKV